MLHRLQLLLDHNGLDYKQGSSMQGVMMERMNQEYGTFLHDQNFHPYHQTIVRENGQSHWIIHTLTDEAYENILRPLESDEFNSFSIHNYPGQIRILEKKKEAISLTQLLASESGQSDTVSVILSVRTPASFKSKGKYMNLPDLRLIYQNLLLKYAEAADSKEVLADGILEGMCESSRIARFDIRSCSFPLEGITVPGFIGNVMVNIRGKAGAGKFARMLFRFGTFSGLGIKTSMGMGNYTLLDQWQERK